MGRDQSRISMSWGGGGGGGGGLGQFFISSGEVGWLFTPWVGSYIIMGKAWGGGGGGKFIGFWEGEASGDFIKIAHCIVCHCP